jgi:hypothetical protein
LDNNKGEINMKAYGLPRNDDVENPDVADIKFYGLNTSAGGRDYFKNKSAKAATRRGWKRRARRANKNLCKR